VAVDGLPELGYYVLTEENVVYRYTKSGAGLQFSSRFSLNEEGRGVDLTLVRENQQISVAVTQWTGSLLRTGFVFRYSPEGKVISKWQTKHVPTGIDFDIVNHRIYFATADSNELYSVDLQGNEPKYACEVYGARQLGPIALDAERQLVYAADSVGGLFVADLASKKVTQLSSSFGLASALRLDSKRRILFVADNVQKKIFAVDLVTGRQTIIAASAQLRGPTGLALDPEDNSLLITDQRPGNVFLAPLNSPGKRASPFPQAAKKKK
jgi:sugar lactone lactonase YvrE